MLLLANKPANSLIALEIQAGDKEASIIGDLPEKKRRCNESIEGSDLIDGFFQWGQDSAIEEGYIILAVLKLEY